MRDQWNSKVGFLLAAIGSAVGLGNIWRFPYVAATSGGGAFLLPYFFAIITAGIPILIMEYTIGKVYRGGAPSALARMNHKFEWLGWFQVMVAFMILVYYFAIVVWTLSYVGYAFTDSWGADPEGFFFGEYLQASSGPFDFAGLKMNLLVPFLAVWVLIAIILFRGVSRGIELACKVSLPLLFLMMIIIVIRGLTLPGSVDGLEYLFAPDWTALKDPNIWVAAYGQIFYSLSVGFAIMIAYASYLPKESDVVNSAFITATANHGFELLAGIGVFAVMGFMAAEQGVGVEDVIGGGIGLAFITFPRAISSLPTVNVLFGFCFFGALFIAGVTSVVSIAQAVISGLHDKFDIDHKKAVTLVLVPAFILSFLFITGAGIHILDIVDAFTNQVGIAVGGVIEVILICWFFNPEEIRKMANEFSNFSIGKWWTFCLKIVTTVVLGIMTVLNIYKFATQGYGGYEMKAITVYGWGVMALIIIGATVLYFMKGKPGYADEIPSEEEREAETAEREV